MGYSAGILLPNKSKVIKTHLISNPGKQGEICYDPREKARSCELSLMPCVALSTARTTPVLAHVVQHVGRWQQWALVPTPLGLDLADYGTLCWCPT